MQLETSRLRHDLRTPVNHILGYSQLLIEEVDSGTLDHLNCFQAVSGLGKEILRQIEINLSPSESSPIEPRLLELRTQLRPLLEQIRHNLQSVPIQQSSSQFADVQRILQAVDKLSGFVISGALGQTEGAGAPVRPGENATQTEHILVVDDDYPNREVLARMLRRLNYRVSAAASGAEAIELAGKNCFSLVLLDLLMPQMSGYEVLEHLQISAPDTPVIVISAVDNMDAVIRCITIGAEDYFVKPFEAMLLRARITAALARHRYRRQRRDQPGPEIGREIGDSLKLAANLSLDAERQAARLGEAVLCDVSEANRALRDLEQDLREIRKTVEDAHGRLTRSLQLELKATP